MRQQWHSYGEDPSQYGELTRGGDPAGGSPAAGAPDESPAAGAPDESPAAGAPDESPAAGTPAIAILLHGGFWKATYGCELMHPLATLADVAAGIDHLADLDGLDLSRVIAIGHSAGGHLAAWAATRNSPRVALTGVVAQAGVVDLRLARELRLSDATVHRFLDALDDEDLAAASPSERLPLNAPALLTHGEADDTVPVRMSREFAAAAGAELHVDPQAGHMEHLDPTHPLWEAVIAWL